MNRQLYDQAALKVLRSDARAKVREFFWLQTADKRLAEQCTQLVYGPICQYEHSLHSLKVRREGQHFVYERVPADNSAVRGLLRLQRAADAGGYLWNKAWAEATDPVRNLIYAAANGPITIPVLRAPDRNLIAPLIPAALQLARAPRTRTAERDQAVIAILHAYQKIYNTRPLNPGPRRPRKETITGKASGRTATLWPAPSHKHPGLTTIEFIHAVEKAFEQLLPRGFGVSRSKATLHRLIKTASEALAP